MWALGSYSVRAPHTVHSLSVPLVLILPRPFLQTPEVHRIRVNGLFSDPTAGRRTTMLALESSSVRAPPSFLITLEPRVE